MPLTLISEHLGVSRELADEAIAMACLVTSLTTAHLGTLSAICGCNNAAGIGLAAGLVVLHLLQTLISEGLSKWRNR